MSKQALDKMSDSFISQLHGHLGAIARPNGTFYSYTVATRALTRLRLDILNGKNLTDKGEAFLAGAASYLATLCIENWKRRNLEVAVDASFAEGSALNTIKITAKRSRAGACETYSHDIWRDARVLFLSPPQWFPYCGPWIYQMSSLVLPSPEFLYLYGAFLMQSPHAVGNWPRTDRPGGLESDFEQSKQLLIDDLHRDAGLPLNDQAMRKLSYWVVFPPYGWMENTCGNYNLMTLFSQISERPVLPLDDAMSYLRGLLRSQALDVRNLAARCLMAYRQPPKCMEEAVSYKQALIWSDQLEISNYLYTSQWRIEGHDPATEQPPAQWFEQIEKERARWLAPAEQYGKVLDPIENDPRYQELPAIAERSVNEAITALKQLLDCYPNNWLVKMLYSSQLMNGPDPKQGELMLREQVKGTCPSPEAHLRLGTLLKKQGRLKDALTVFEDAVKKFPIYNQAVDSCLWVITEGMTQ